MAEYISRDDVRRMILDYRSDNPKKQTVWAMVISDMLRDLKEMPAADVQPVKHGHWKEEDIMPYDNFVVCSECGMNLSYQNYTKEEWQESFRYCPCCGARMDGDAE